MVPGPGKLRVVFTPDGPGDTIDLTVHEFVDSGGVSLSMFNTDKVIHPLHFMLS